MRHHPETKRVCRSTVLAKFQRFLLGAFPDGGSDQDEPEPLDVIQRKEWTMRREIWNGFATAIVVALLSGCASKTDYAALITGIEENFTSIKNYQLSPYLYIPQAGTDVQAQARFVAPNKIKVEVTYPISITIVCDGQKLSGCVSDFNTCLSLPLDRMDGPYPAIAVLKLLTPHLCFVGMCERYDWAVDGKETLDDKKVILFNLSRKTPPEMSYQAATVKIWVEEARGLARKMEMYDLEGTCKTRAFLNDYIEVNGVWICQELNMETGDGMSLTSMTISDIKINEDLLDGTFTFSPSSDFIVLDEIPPLGNVVPEFLLPD